MLETTPFIHACQLCNYLFSIPSPKKEKENEEKKKKRQNNVTIVFIHSLDSNS